MVVAGHLDPRDPFQVFGHQRDRYQGHEQFALAVFAEPGEGQGIEGEFAEQAVEELLRAVAFAPVLAHHLEVGTALGEGPADQHFTQIQVDFALGGALADGLFRQGRTAAQRVPDAVEHAGFAGGVGAGNLNDVAFRRDLNGAQPFHVFGGQADDF